MAFAKRLGIAVAAVALVGAAGIAIGRWHSNTERYVCSKGGDSPVFSVTVTPGILRPTLIYVHTTPYRVTTFTGALYEAEEAQPESADAVGNLEFDIVTGSLMQTNRISARAVEIVSELCEKKITDDQCKKQMEIEHGGNIFACYRPR